MRQGLRFLRAKLPGILATRGDVLSPRMLQIIEDLAADWPCDAHHIRFGQPRALGREVSDEFTVPLCRVHHRDLHRRSDERAWWEAANIEPMEIAERLWRETRDKMS